MNNFIYKTLFILVVLLIYRMGSFVTIPAIDANVASLIFETTNNQLIQAINMFSGGGAERVSILVLGIMPFITAAILVQGLALFLPQLKALKESGEKGQIELNRYIKYLSFFIAIGQTIALSIYITELIGVHPELINTDYFSFLILFFVSTIGGVFITMFFAEMINEYGYGSGVSFIIFTNIATSIPSLFGVIIESFYESSNAIYITLFLLSLFALFFFVIVFENATKKIVLSSPIDYKSKNYLPIKLNVATIMPAIFIFMIMSMFLMVDQFLSNSFDVSIILYLQNNVAFNSALYWLNIYFFITLVALFYSQSVFNTKSIAENLKNTNTYIKGIRPNKPTVEYLERYRVKLSLVSSLFLFVIIFVPDTLSQLSGITFLLGGISILIMANVSYEVKKNFDLSNKEKNIKILRNEIINKISKR